MQYLALDLGSSFLKGAVLDLDQRRVGPAQRVPFPDPIPGLPPGFREYDPAAVVSATRALLERLAAEAPEAGGCLICSQLHSLVFAGPQGQPFSNIITWQDQRALQPFGDTGRTYFDEINRQLTPEERRQLGNEARPGVPLCFLFWLKQHHALPAPTAIAASLPSFVVANLCGVTPALDLTNAFAHGALEIQTGDWHRGVIAKLGLDRVQWPAILPQGAVLGQAPFAGRPLRFFAPVGDYHCSQVGAGLQPGELSINISTGSAVIQLAPRLEWGDFQTRPWFDGRFLKTITHIPGGRALDALLRLLCEVAQAQGVRLRDPWAYALAQAGRLPATSLHVNPAFYAGAMGDHGAITNACEENLTVGHLFRAALEGMAENYAQCARRVCPAGDWRRLLFSGGVALKTPLLRRLICGRLGPEHRLAPSEEDTLLGLLALALAFSGRATSVLAAMTGLGDRFEVDALSGSRARP